MKSIITNIVASLTIMSIMYGVGVSIGVFHPPAGVAQVERRLTALETVEYISRVEYLLKKWNAQNYLDGHEMTELCAKAILINWNIEGCRA